MANTNAMQTINGIPLVEGTHIEFWGTAQEDIFRGRTGTVSSAYPDSNLVAIHWDEIPGRDVQTTISMATPQELMSNELVAYDGSRLYEGVRVVFRGREDSDISRGRRGTVVGVFAVTNQVAVHWDDVPNYGSRSSHSANDVVSEAGVQ